MVSRTVRPEHERGSALLLIPSMFMVLLLATGLVVDGAIAFAAKRDLAEAAGAAANDAAAAIDEVTFYDTGNITVDVSRAQRMADASLAQRSRGLSPHATVEVAAVELANGETGVEVVVRSTVHLLFSRILPFGLSNRPLLSTARAASRHRETSEGP